VKPGEVFHQRAITMEDGENFVGVGVDEKILLKLVVREIL
jgi:hypothetical protein